MPALRLLALAVSLSAPSAAIVAQDPQQARLTIDSDTYNVPVGKSFAVKINGERVTMRFELQPDQAFDHSGVSFRYPVGFETEESTNGGAVTIWTLQGRSAAVMLQRYAAGIDPDSLSDVLVQNIIDQYGDNAVKQTPVKLRGAEASYQGLQLRTENGGTEIVQNVFAFANGEGVFALMVQDTHKPGEEDTPEYTEALRLLGESLATGPAPKRPAAPTRPPSPGRERGGAGDR